jgi:hypothetical protein
LNLDVYLTASYTLKIFRWSNTLQAWSDITFNLFDYSGIGYTYNLFTDGRRVYIRVDRGLFEFRGDRWILLLDSPTNNYRTRLDGKFLFDFPSRFTLPGPAAQVASDLPNNDPALTRIHHTASSNGGRVVLATIRNSTDGFGPTPIRFFVFPEAVDSLRNTTLNSTRGFNFGLDSASFLGSEALDSAIGSAIGLDQDGVEQLVLGANIPSPTVTLGSGSLISLLGSATTSSAGTIISKKLNDPSAAPRLVRVGAALVDVAVSRGPGSQILTAMSDRTVLLANNNLSSVIWTYTFPPSLPPRAIAVDEQGTSAVLCANSSSSTTFQVSLFNSLGQIIANISYSSISVGLVQMTSDYGGVLWISAQRAGPDNNMPLLHAYSTTNFTRLYTLWDYSYAEYLLFNSSGAGIRRLHYGLDKQLYFLSFGFGSNSPLRTDGRDANSNILTYNVSNTGSTGLLGRIDPARSKVVLGQFDIPLERFGPPNTIFYRAGGPSIAANSKGEVWIAGSSQSCLSGFEAKRLNCLKLSNCSGDALVIKLTRGFTRVAVWTPVSLSGLSNSRAFLAVGANRTAAFYEVAANASAVSFYTTNSTTAGSRTRIGVGNSTDLWLGIWQDPQPFSRCDRQIASDIPKFVNLDPLRLSLLAPSDPIFSAPGSIFNSQPYADVPNALDAPRDAAVFVPTSAIAACAVSPSAAVGGIVACAVLAAVVLILAVVALIHPAVSRLCGGGNLRPKR